MYIYIYVYMCIGIQEEAYAEGQEDENSRDTGATITSRELAKWCRCGRCVSRSRWATCLSHCLTVSLSHCLTVLLSRCLTVSLSHCLIVWLSYAFAVLTPTIRFVLAYSSLPSASIITVITPCIHARNMYEMLVSVRVFFSFHLVLNLCTFYSGLTQKEKRMWRYWQSGLPVSRPVQEKWTRKQLPGNSQCFSGARRNRTT